MFACLVKCQILWFKKCKITWYFGLLVKRDLLLLLAGSKGQITLFKKRLCSFKVGFGPSESWAASCSPLFLGYNLSETQLSVMMSHRPLLHDQQLSQVHGSINSIAELLSLCSSRGKCLKEKIYQTEGFPLWALNENTCIQILFSFSLLLVWGLVWNKLLLQEMKLIHFFLVIFFKPERAKVVHNDEIYSTKNFPVVNVNYFLNTEVTNMTELSLKSQDGYR